MTWLPLQASGLSYDQSMETGVTFADSVITVAGAEAITSGLHWYININTTQKHENEALGWDGRIRLTCTSINVTSPGSGQPFEYIYLVKAYSGEFGSWIQSVINNEPPYPDFIWGTDAVTDFVPNELVTGPNVSDDNEYSARYFLSCPTGDSISYQVFIEAFVDDSGPGCFWTDLENVEQEC